MKGLAVPRYYLHIRDRGDLIEDPEGEDASSLADIRSVAENVMEDILRRPGTYGEAQRWNRRTFEIADEHGDVVLRLPFFHSG